MDDFDMIQMSKPLYCTDVESLTVRSHSAVSCPAGPLIPADERKGMVAFARSRVARLRER